MSDRARFELALAKRWSQDKLDALIERCQPIIDKIKIVRKYEVPLLAGADKNLAKTNIVYVDEDVPTELEAGDQEFSPDETLPWHEVPEWLLMVEGDADGTLLDYDDAHEVALQVEEWFVTVKKKLDWKAYSKAFDKWIKTIADRELKSAPPDLYRGPYDSADEKKFLDELNPVEATEQKKTEKAGGDRPGIRPLPDATDQAALKSATFAAPASATSGLQSYALEGAKATKIDAEYNPGPVSEEPCNQCSMFVRPDECKSVDGPINPDGHCKLFDRAKSHKDRKRAKYHGQTGVLLGNFDDDAIKVAMSVTMCAGMALVSPQGRALFLKRSEDSDHPGEWCFPGGHIEDGETAEQAAVRECIEEIGSVPDGEREPCAHLVVDGDVDFTTFRLKVGTEFEPVLNGEHVDHVWAPLNEAPQPLHPWVMATLPLIESGATAKMHKGAKRTLYVHRPLTNIEDFTAWAKSQGFATVLADPHVTIAWSKDKLDWLAPDSGDLIVSADDDRTVVPLGDKGAVVLRFESPDLQERWQEFRDAGASWDHPGLKPHVSITFDGADVDLSKVEPWTGALEFGPEVFAPIDKDWQDTITEKGVCLVKHTGSAPAEEDTTTMDKLKLFVPILKVDAVQRMVYGTAADEAPDHTKEIFDYETSKPLFQAWSAGFEKVTEGKSLGNVRAMHGKVAAGKLSQLGFDDTRKSIDVGAKIVDDAEWAKVEEGVYTGFSIGGSYVKKWKDGDHTRYTANPSEISLVDLPCIPTAMFSMIKADGTEELRKFKTVQVEIVEATAEQIAAKATELAKAAGDPAKWVDHIEAARAELAKAAPEAAEANVPKGGKKTPPHDGKQGHMANEGDTETKIGDGGHKVAATQKNPKTVANDKDKHPPVVSDKEKEAGADSHVKGVDEGEIGNQMWVSKRLPGQLFAKKAELRQALVDLDAAEAAAAKAGPVLDALKGITAELDKREGKKVEFTIAEMVAKGHDAKVCVAVCPTIDASAEDWATFKAWLGGNADNLAKALPNTPVPPMVIDEAGTLTVPPATAIAISKLLKKAKAEALAKREFTDAERTKLAASGAAMRDGSFPIENASDLENAVQAHGRSKNKAAAKRHIVRRAKALGATDKLPDDWKAKKLAGDGDMQKGVSFYGVANLLQLLSSLEYAEEAAEVDEYWGGAINVSKELKDRFGQAIVEVADIAAELLDAVVSAMREEESREAMERAAPILDLMKIGARNSKTDKATIKKAHDAIVELDNDCCPAGDGEAGKAATVDSLQKKIDANDQAYTKALAEIGTALKDVGDRVKKIDGMDERIKRIDETPMPVGPGNFRAVDKGHQLVEHADTIVEQPGALEKLADAAIRQSHRHGYRVG